MKKYLIILAVLLSVCLLCLTGCARQSVKQAAIEEFIAMDMPYDNGAGVFLKWKPLDKSQRIIQYNIYRGCSPDSMFFLNKIEVDPKNGVASPWLSYNDKDYGTLLTLETAPAKLSKEKHQTSTGTLYKGVPRDARILGELLPQFSVYGDINSPKYYKHSRRIELKGKEKPEIFAGYSLNQFNSIMANPKAERTYYYCVVPVNETGSFLKATEIVPVRPVNNRPDSTAILYTAYLRDRNEIRFEWSPPQGSSDIVYWEFWLMPKTMLDTFKADQRANASAPDSIFNADWQGGSILLHTTQPAYWGQTFYDKVDLTQSGVNLPPLDKLSDYIPVMTYTDNWTSEDGSRTQNYTSAALGNPLTVHTSVELPMLPKYSVLDKKNDKGDNLIVSFGRPLVFVTQAVYTNKDKTRMRVNYDIADNGHQQVDNIQFRFLDEKGNLLAESKERYVDKIIRPKLPKRIDPSANFRVEITTRLINERTFSKDVIKQELVYEASSFRFASGDVSIDGQVLNNTYYDVFSTNKLYNALYPGMRIGALSRAYDQTVSFPTTEFVSITGYDKKTNTILVDPHFTAASDAENGYAFSPSFYKKDFLNEIKDLEKEIKDLSAKVAPGDTLSEDAMTLKADKGTLAFVTGLSAYKQALQAKSDRVWRKVLRKELDRNSRSYSYSMLATDGKALWSDETDFPQLFGKKGSNPVWYYPFGDWFDATKSATLIATILMGIIVVYALFIARRKEMYIRPIAGLEELDNAVGRATEMGRPVMFVPGWGSLGDVDTIASMMILSQIAKKTAEYDIRLICPNVDYYVVPLFSEIIQASYSSVGRPDAFNQNDIFFVSDAQFAFSAAVNGITIRERVATVFYMGYFFAEALLMTETGNQAGAIQIAATDAITQVPFFITTCDYTLIGEEFYAASAYLSRDIDLVAMLKSQDYFKFAIILGILIGTILSCLNINALLNFMPFE
jgi:hypothetical protein